ncbi:hypothetical protein SAMN05216267_1002250 [Actinacidiphila rubida]|uniref:Uncharacterized protein n=1 Tax=Actinacidiphila rubida TaxID=310780 RepID=A0A1H8EJP5_9ACTN|nr:hypothetical protein SAMN05216267_1002250 [Actinacidiphila rubida]
MRDAGSNAGHASGPGHAPRRRTGVRVGRDVGAGGYPTGLALWEVGGVLNVATADDDDAVVRRWDGATGQQRGELSQGYAVAAGQLAGGAVAPAVGTLDGSLRVARVRRASGRQPAGQGFTLPMTPIRMPSHG